MTDSELVARPLMDEIDALRNDASKGTLIGYPYEALHAIARRVDSRIEALAAEVQRLRDALDESVKLQSHQAGMLNMYDGGERLKFADGDAWIARLVECGRWK